MLWVPQKGVVRVEKSSGAAGSVTTAVTTDASSSATKGTPVELIASTAFDAYWMTVVAKDYAANGVESRGCLDILIGASTESILIADLLMGYSPNNEGAKTWDFPLYVPAGSRLAAQVAGARLASACGVAIFLYGGDSTPNFRVGGAVTTYGIGTVPAAVAVTAASDPTEGSWTEITSATSVKHFALVPSIQCNAETAVDTTNIKLDIGIGSATEQLVGTSYYSSVGTGDEMAGPVGALPIFQDIPASTRIAARVQRAGGNDNYQVAVHGVT